MTIRSLEIDEFIAAVPMGATILDVRSPKEFAQGHMPGAINLPLLNDIERHEVGLTYKNQGNHAAVKLGFRLTGYKFIDYIETAEQYARGGLIYVYCWRGGLRSNTMAWLLASAGMQVMLLKGGYKQYRNWCLERFRIPLPLVAISGKTGAGKTELLQALGEQGAAVIDLEALALHRGSAFGGLGLGTQPTQEAFENMLAMRLWEVASNERVWVENESRFIGKLRIPDHFFVQLKRCPLVTVERDVMERAKRILAEYGSFSESLLIEKTKSITKRMGGDRVKMSVSALESGDRLGWVLPLLDYYDRNYEHSIQSRVGKEEHVISAAYMEAPAIVPLLRTIKFNVNVDL